MNKPIHITLPLTIVGTAIGVKADGGILQTTMREIELACLPKDIPDSIEVDVSALEVGDSLHVTDLDIPNVKILSEESRTIVVVQAPTVITEPTTGEEDEGAEGVEGAEGEEGAEGAEGDSEDSGDEKKEK